MSMSYALEAPWEKAFYASGNGGGLMNWGVSELHESGDEMGDDSGGELIGVLWGRMEDDEDLGEVRQPVEGSALEWLFECDGEDWKDTVHTAPYVLSQLAARQRSVPYASTEASGASTCTVSSASSCTSSPKSSPDAQHACIPCLDGNLYRDPLDSSDKECLKRRAVSKDLEHLAICGEVKLVKRSH
jgi:hypothetical protein